MNSMHHFSSIVYHVQAWGSCTRTFPRSMPQMDLAVWQATAPLLAELEAARWGSDFASGLRQGILRWWIHNWKLLIRQLASTFDPRFINLWLINIGGSISTISLLWGAPLINQVCLSIRSNGMTKAAGIIQKSDSTRHSGMGSAQKVTQFHSHFDKPVGFHQFSWVSKAQKHASSKYSPTCARSMGYSAIGCTTEVPGNQQCCDWIKAWLIILPLWK